MRELLLPAAVLGPAAAGAVWALLAAWRWPRRIGGALVALAAHSAGWAVLWLAYRGESPSWRSLDVTLLGATVMVAAELGVMLAALRIEGLGRRAALVAMPALGTSATAVAFASFSTSMVVQAIFVPVVTMGPVLAGLSGAGRRDVAGVLGLAAADVACLGGLALIVLRLGSVVVSPTGSLDAGTALVLAGAAVKAGAVPGVGTWRLAATEGPGAAVASALRGQGIALAVLAGVTISGSGGSFALAAVAAAAALGCGAAAAASARPGAVLSGLTGAAACVPFVALGLGGAIGIRAFLLSFPAFLLGAGAAFAAGWPGMEPERRRNERALLLRRWVGVPAAFLAAISLAGLPAGGAHPGTALAMDLAGARAHADAWYLAVAAALLLGLGMSALAAASVVAAARPPLAGGVAAMLSGAALVYMGSQPVRLGIGWWLRIERDLEVPSLLPSAGAPSFPALDGLDLALVLGPAAAVAVLVAALGRGVRADRTAPTPLTLPGAARPALAATWTGPPAVAVPLEAGEAQPETAIQPEPGAAQPEPDPGARGARPEPEVAEPPAAPAASRRLPARVAAPGRRIRLVARATSRRTAAAVRPASLLGASAGRAIARRYRALARWTGRRARAMRARAQRLALGLAAAALLEVGAVALSVFLVMEGIRLGFL